MRKVVQQGGNMSKRFGSVSDMMKDLNDGSAQAEAIQKDLKRSQISSILFVMRNKQNLTQGQMAEKLGWSQSKVSKMEHQEDTHYSVSEITDYCSALGYNLEIGFSLKSETWLDKVKRHYTHMHRYLNKISDSAQGDAAIQKGVNQVMIEASGNLLHLVEVCIGKVKKPPKSPTSLIVSRPEVPDEDYAQSVSGTKVKVT